MSRRGNSGDGLDRLRDRLVAADPAAGGAELSPEAAARIRRAMLDAVQGNGVARGRVPFIAAAALIACGALVGYQLWIRHGGSAPVSSARVGATAPELPQKVRIEFTTERGTRIVWIVDPEFRLD